MVNQIEQKTQEQERFFVDMKTCNNGLIYREDRSRSKDTYRSDLIKYLM